MAKTKEELDLASIRIKPYWNRFFPGYVIPTEGVDPQQLGKEKLRLYVSLGFVQGQENGFEK
jgi:hypothetical protein